MSEKATAVQKAPEPKEPAAMKLVGPETLFDRINQLHEATARRAFQLFEGEGRIFGRDLDHWFRAEEELLHSVHVRISESGNALEVAAEVPGFNAKELEVSVEPQRLTISGKRESTEERKKGETVYKEQCSNEILRVVDLPAEIETSKVTATLKEGVLTLNLPKTARAKAAATEVDVKTA
ncbi:MAG: Hsp20 family protein [Candidatus Sulfotelmatobacter sp.]